MSFLLYTATSRDTCDRAPHDEATCFIVICCLCYCCYLCCLCLYYRHHHFCYFTSTLPLFTA